MYTVAHETSFLVVDVLLPFVCVMCNTSLREGCLPRTRKTAIIITPVLKKQNADPDEPRNYRPISNLTFISKVLQRIVVEQVTQHHEEVGISVGLLQAPLY